MFSRRRRPSPANPRIDPGTAAAATTAATSAFGRLNQPTANGTLSSAAAAAALRSHTSTPEPVGSIQTKRMIRRNSNSSQGSMSVVGSLNGRPGVRRTDSNSSMTERTFRAPSPASPMRPASSLGSTTTRFTSPPPAKGKRSSSADQPPPSTSLQAKRLSNVMEGDELERAHADFAKNLAARRAEADSGGASKAVPLPKTAESANQATRSERPTSPDAQTSSMPSTLRQPAPASRTSSAAGSHLSNANNDSGRVYGVQPGTSYNAPSRVYDPNTRSFVYKSAADAQPPPSPTRPTVETVYDPNSRRFVPKSQASSLPPAVRAARASSVSPTRASAAVTSQRQRPSSALAGSMKPPPKNPARYAQTAERPTSPTVTTLHKQPSVVREDTRGEEEAEAAAPPAKQPATNTQQQTILPAKTYTARPEDHGRSSSLDVPRVGYDAALRGRNVSQSPQRSARFSPSPVLLPQIHVPPPRDISPGKSAMKHSPASSIRTASPIAAFSPLGLHRVTSPGSETSESPSMGAQDGAKKKKSVRVSFDEHSLGGAAPVLLPSPILNRSPQMGADDDVEMPSRQVLPSFGSVRRDRVQPDPAEKVTEMIPSSQGTSSDHAIAGILRNSRDPVPPEVTSKESAGYESDDASEANVPVSIPEEAPAVIPIASATAPASDSTAPTVRDFAPTTVEQDNVPAQEPPAIALFPPTPKLDEDNRGSFLSPPTQEVSKRNSMEGISVPGGWAGDADEPATIVAEPSVPKATPEIFDGAAQDSMSIPMTTSDRRLSAIDEDTDDAEFSDAFEDPSDFEDDGPGGFASLDAIVESPVVPLSPSRPRDPPISPTRTTAPTNNVNDSPSTPSWDQATAYWSQLTKEKRAELERANHSSDEDDDMQPARTAKPKAARGVNGNIATSVQPVPTMRKSMRAPTGPSRADSSASSGHMRKSMREGGRLTSSLREAPARDDSHSALQKKSLRPASMGAPATSAPRTQAQSSAYPTSRTKNAQPQQKQTRAQTAQFSTRLQKELAAADDSDSESSFKKRRKARGNEARYTMRGSMRDAAAYESPRPQSPIEQRPSSPPPSSGNSRFSRLRSMSPNPFSRRKNSISSVQSQEPVIKSTLRSTAAPPAAARKTQSRQTPAPSAPRYKSRFADSDDEDDDAPKRSFFKSRFADSDDEDGGPAPSSVRKADLTPVRGIPRRKDREDGDSTDLEEEDDAPRRKGGKKGGLTQDPAEVDKVMALARRNLGMAESPAAPSNQGPHEGALLQKGSLRVKPAGGVEDTPQSTASKPSDITFAMPEKKRRGFMGSILRRNRNSSSSIQQLTGSASPPATPVSPQQQLQQQANSNRIIERPTSPTPTSPTGRPPMAKLRKNSSQRVISRNSSYLADATPVAAVPPPPPSALARGSSYMSNRNAAPATPSSTLPKLSNQELDSWQRPTSPSVTGTPDRPTTSEGFSSDAVKLAHTLRPDLAPRSQSQQLPASSALAGGAGGAAGGRRVQIQAGEEGSEPGEREKSAAYIVSAKTGKKKKFGGLRRVFGLND